MHVQDAAATAAASCARYRTPCRSPPRPLLRRLCLWTPNLSPSPRGWPAGLPAACARCASVSRTSRVVSCVGVAPRAIGWPRRAERPAVCHSCVIRMERTILRALSPCTPPHATHRYGRLWCRRTSRASPAPAGAGAVRSPCPTPWPPPEQSRHRQRRHPQCLRIRRLRGISANVRQGPPLGRRPRPAPPAGG